MTPEQSVAEIDKLVKDGRTVLQVAVGKAIYCLAVRASEDQSTIEAFNAWLPIFKKVPLKDRRVACINFMNHFPHRIHTFASETDLQRSIDLRKEKKYQEKPIDLDF